MISKVLLVLEVVVAIASADPIEQWHTQLGGPMRSDPQYSPPKMPGGDQDRVYIGNGLKRV